MKKCTTTPPFFSQKIHYLAILDDVAIVGPDFQITGSGLLYVVKCDFKKLRRCFVYRHYQHLFFPPKIPIF